MVVCVATVLGGAGTMTPGAVAGAVAPAPVRGYVVVDSGPISLPAAAQTFGKALCPMGTVVYGGGATSTAGIYGTINTSAPYAGTSQGWAVIMNETHARDVGETFDVYAICGRQPKLYAIFSAAVTGTAGAQNAGQASCAAGKVLGGGAVLLSSSVSDAINSTFPGGRTYWVVDANNASGSNPGFTVYAVCGKLPGYKQVRSVLASDPAGSQATTSVACPINSTTGGQEYPISGGVISSAIDTTASYADGWPSGSSWYASEDNTGAVNQQLGARAVCAGK